MTNQSSKTTTEQESVSPNKNHENKAKSLAKKFAKRYFIDALGAMVYGLFASLLIGTILKTIFQYIHVEAFQAYFQQIIFWTGAASPLVGAAIGVSVAYGLKSKPLAMYSAVVVGGLAYTMNAVVVTTGSFSAITFSGKGSAGPVGAIIAVIIAVEIGSWLTDKTPFNILVVPAASILSGTLVAILVGPPVGHFMTWLGVVLEKATQLYPFPMGIAVSFLVGLSLVAPISSAALCVSIGISGLSAGAATAGCCAQMVGFAVASFRENRWGGLVSQGIGTAKIQFPNILRHPQILIPTLMASAVAGPLSTCVFKMTNSFIGAGMGTCGLVGPIEVFRTMTDAGRGSLSVLLSILLVYILIPACVALGTSEVMRRLGWIKKGDMLLIRE